MLDSTRWVVHLPVHRDEEQPKAEEYGPDAVVVNVPGEQLTKAYVPLLWGAATGRIAAIVGSTPATSAASELQTMRMARALALYVVGRLARPTTRTGFFWTMPMCSFGEDSGQLLKEFVKVTGMREFELNLGKFGAPGRKPLSATTNYHLDGLSPRSTSEEGTEDQSLLDWPTALKLKLAKAVRESSFEDRHVALGGSMKAMTPEKMERARSFWALSSETGLLTMCHAWRHRASTHESRTSFIVLPHSRYHWTVPYARRRPWSKGGSS